MKRIAVFTILLTGLVLSTSMAAQTENGSLEIEIAWSKLRTVMQHRADLVINLVNTYKGAVSKPDKQLVKSITDAAQDLQLFLADKKGMPDSLTVHTAWNKHNYLQEAGLGKLLSAIITLKDKQEDMKALQGQLEAVENRIVVARKSFSLIAEKFNHPELVLKKPAEGAPVVEF